MKNRGRNARPIWAYVVLFIMAVIFLTGYIIITTEPATFSNKRNVRNFSDGWLAETGEILRADDIHLKEYGGVLTIEKKLPGNVGDSDCLCFESINATFTIWVDDREIYYFKPEENISGRGYGSAFHQVALKASDSSHVLRIRMEGALSRYGRMRGVCLAPAADFIHRGIIVRTIPALISGAVLFLGLFMIFLYPWIPDKENMPFDILALAAMAIIIGGWLLMDTGIMQLLTGYIYLWRGLNRTVVLLSGYPCVCFFNSITEQKKRIYNHIAFWFNFAVVVVTLGGRFLLGADLAIWFSAAISVLIGGSAVIMAVIMTDNVLYSRAHGIPIGIRNYYPGIIVFVACAALDMILYLRTGYSISAYGNYSRFGMLFFILSSLVQFFSWWMRDRATIKRDRFLNEALQYAISSVSPEESIRYLLSYLGKELGPARIAIFEDQGNGKYHGTYEWYRDGLASAGLNLMYLPYKGFVEEQYRIFEENDRRLIVRDPEEYRTALPALYQVLHSYNIRTIVSGPLEYDGRMIGFLTFMNAPEELLEETAEIIAMVSYFLTQLIQKREEQKRLQFYSYNDSLTGALNRRAYTEFVESELDLSVPFGYISCYLNRFETVNNTQGYEAGDRMALGLVQGLQDVFGKEHVYRLGGAGFAVFGFETDEAYFENDVERFRRIMKEKELDVSVGAVYCAYGAMSIDKVIRHAAELMRADD